jgi:hypothetical protein
MKQRPLSLGWLQIGRTGQGAAYVVINAVIAVSTIETEDGLLHSQVELHFMVVIRY